LGTERRHTAAQWCERTASYPRGEQGGVQATRLLPQEARRG
jgi:hypothetical protein